MMAATCLAHAMLWIPVHLLVMFAVISSCSEYGCVLHSWDLSWFVSKCTLIKAQHSPLPAGSVRTEKDQKRSLTPAAFIL